jgi:hypothetical protein
MNNNFKVALLALVYGVGVVAGTVAFIMVFRPTEKAQPVVTTKLSPVNPTGILDRGLANIRERDEEEKLRQQLAKLEERVRQQEEKNKIRQTKEKMERVASSSYPMEVYVYDPPSNVRELPTTSSGVLCTLYQGGFIYTFGKVDKGWYLTYICNGQLGAIHESQVKTIEEL